MLAYQPSSARERTPLRRRASGIALAVAINLLLLLVLLGIGKLAPLAHKTEKTIVVDFLPPKESAAAPAPTKKSAAVKTASTPLPTPKPPPVVLPVKPTIQPPPKSQPWLEMSKDELANADISKLSHSGAGVGSSGDSEAVGTAPNGDVLYAAEWARHPTDAELGGYLPKNAPDGYGLVACKTLPEDRVDDCVELEDYPLGSHLARAVRLAAWQFRVRPPRKNGHPLVGSWVRIRIDYEKIETSSNGL